LICCSIGVTTVEATTSALAPGYWPVTLMIGGAISGYWAIGRRENDTPPTITKMIEMTAAKMGRSMKKCEMRICCPDSEISQIPCRRRSVALGLGARLWHALPVLRRHLLARVNPHQPVHHHAIVGRDAVLDHAHVVDHLPERHEALVGDIVLV